MERVDIAIIGSGPAGISAALNARIRRKSFILFGSNRLSDKIQCSEQIENYPGLSGITGAELNDRLREHLERAEISITEKRITGVYNMGDYFAMLSDQEMFEAKTVILATGVEAVKPILGERELVGRGVSYCATCDGNLYRGKTIAVICDNALMEEEVEYLAGLAEKVYYYPQFKGSEFAAKNVEILASPLKEIFSEGGRVSGIRCRDEREIPLDGVFFIKQSVSPAVLLQGIEMEGNHVKVDRTMATSVDGCFAAGDCVGGPYQIAKAVGEGNIAAHSAFTRLAALKKK